MDVAGVDFVDDFGGQITQHALGADIEELNDSFFVGGDNREIRTRENCVLQSACFKQRFLTPSFGDAIRVADIFENEGISSLCEHGGPLFSAHGVRVSAVS